MLDDVSRRIRCERNEEAAGVPLPESVAYTRARAPFPWKEIV